MRTATVLCVVVFDVLSEQNYRSGMHPLRPASTHTAGLRSWNQLPNANKLYGPLKAVSPLKAV